MTSLRLCWLRLKAVFAPKPKRTIYGHEMSPEQQQAFDNAFASLNTAFDELGRVFTEEPKT